MPWGWPYFISDADEEYIIEISRVRKELVTNMVRKSLLVTSQRKGKPDVGHVETGG